MYTLKPTQTLLFVYLFVVSAHCLLPAGLHLLHHNILNKSKGQDNFIYILNIFFYVA